MSALLFLGGTEKVENATEQLGDVLPGMQVYIGGDEPADCLPELHRALQETDAEAVIDLSDEPIVSYRERFRLASHALADGVPYAGADFFFTPPPAAAKLSKPSLSVIGTGKRVGKTAIGATIGRLLRGEAWDPIMVCMGRGGPAEPHLVEPRSMSLNADGLLRVAGEGGHAASDYWEEALLAQVPTIGCRRCGGGMGGTPATSTVVRGARMADESAHCFIVLEGSGATFAPVPTDRRIIVVGAGQERENVTGYLGEYRLLTSDLAIVTMCEEPNASARQIQQLKEDILRINPDIDVALTVFRPQPLGAVNGKKVFLATTAPEKVAERMGRQLEDEHNCRVEDYSVNLSNRRLLRKELSDGLRGCDVLLTEIKAGSIDVAVRMARDEDVEPVFLHNQPVLTGGTVDDLQESIIGLCRQAEAAHR